MVLIANWAALASVVALAAVTELMNISFVFGDLLSGQSTEALLLRLALDS
jgi:hypothetical protein